MNPGYRFAVAKRLAEKWGILDQVQFKPGDITTIDYGDSEFDVVLLGQITYHLNKDENISVLGRIHRSLKSKGVIVIHTPMADEERCKSSALSLAVVLFAFFGEKGGLYTFSEYKGMLENTGFSEVTMYGDSLLSARK